MSLQNRLRSTGRRRILKPVRSDMLASVGPWQPGLGNEALLNPRSSHSQHVLPRDGRCMG